MHNLNIDISKNSKCRFLTIRDESLYDENLPVTNTILEINPPNKSCFYTFNLLVGWCSKTLSCEDFDLCCAGDCKTILPDGNYEIKYSINPNLNTLVEFNYFRVCQLHNSYIKSLLYYFANRCDYSKKDKQCKEKLLREINDLINASVAMAEDKLDVGKAIELYNEASEKLKKINGKDSCSC